nr:hypothetical protein [Tanacetum cinerariifolium]
MDPSVPLKKLIKLGYCSLVMDCFCVVVRDVFRLAFDLKKSSHYKVVKARGEAEFTIYEMMKGSFVWSVSLISNTNTEIFNIGSNQMDDDDADDDDDDAVLFIPPFEVDPNLYEFISSLASV